jgi:putative DNA primase/helicase
LQRLGMPSSYLTGKHSPCPMCGGKDRFRFIDTNGHGTYICSQCGGGNGFTLIQKWKGVDWHDALGLVRPLVDSIPAKKIAPVASDWTRGRKEVSSPWERRWRSETWAKGTRLRADDLVGKYLVRRCRFIPDTRELRTIVAEDGAIMVARFRAPDDSSATLHLTSINTAGERLERKLAPGPVPDGGAVRLMPIDERKVLGIAEGIETALSASVLFHVPVWSALNAGGVSKWQVPAGVQEVMVFADNDQNKVGQRHAETLRLRCDEQGLKVSVHIPEKTGSDWNDVHNETKGTET